MHATADSKPMKPKTQQLSAGSSNGHNQLGSRTWKLSMLSLATAGSFLAAYSPAQEVFMGPAGRGPAVNLGHDVLPDDPASFDNVPTSSFSAFSTSSTPNTFMGDGYNLAPGTTSITGFDVYPVNVSGINFTGLKITIYVWGSVNTSGTVNAVTPAFGNLLATYTLTSAGAFSTGFYFPFESATPGITPGITLATPLSIPSTQIGLTFNYQGTTNGVDYASANNLTSIISSNQPTVGSEVFNGYYRNANSEVDGNFTSSLRSLGGLGAYQSLAVRVYTVPEPTTIAILGLGAAGLFILRRRNQA